MNDPHIKVIFQCQTCYWYATKMGGSDSGVGIKAFLTNWRLESESESESAYFWRLESESESAYFKSESESEPGLAGTAHLWGTRTTEMSYYPSIVSHLELDHHHNNYLNHPLRPVPKAHPFHPR